jgi:hypothetical protein
MRRSEKGDVELLAAYVDGVAELSLDERKRVDDLLARDPALRAQEGDTRVLVGQLRELPPEGGEPDWSALEKGIHAAVANVAHPTRPPWWARWRLLVPGVALAITAAIVAIVLRSPRSVAPVEAPVTRVEVVAPVDTVEDEPLASVPLWLDGTDLDVALEAAELFDLDGDLDEAAVPATAELLPPTDLGWVDDLDPDALDRAEQFLDRPHHRRGRT